VDIKKRIAAGEVYDVVIASGPSIDAFIKQGKIVSESRTDVMKSAVGAAVRAGASKPDIGSSDSLKQTLLTAKSIGYSTGPSGEHIINLVERMGIAEQVKPKLKQVPSGARIGTLIASGEVEIGFQQVSELIHDPSIDYLGPLPEEIGMITVFTGGIHSTAREPEQGKALMKHLTAPAAAASIKAHGMEPG
jgi:molybdate transport system substrate-binding protein